MFSAASSRGVLNLMSVKIKIESARQRLLFSPQPRMAPGVRGRLSVGHSNDERLCKCNASLLYAVVVVTVSFISIESVVPRAGLSSKLGEFLPLDLSLQLVHLVGETPKQRRG